jgi:magnesium-transporting ATPase (P-type)
MFYHTDENSMPLDQQIKNHLQAHPGDEEGLLTFFRCLCLCHDLTIITNAAGKSFPSGPSQDELCLIEMAKRTGFCEFVSRDSSTLTLKVKGQIEVYKNIKFYDFTSERKMMTRIVQNV